MDWDTFHLKAKSVKPAQELPQKRYWVGVLLLDKTPEEPLQETDFVWMKGHAKILVSTIHEQFLQRTKTTSEFELRSKHVVPSSSTVIRDLNHYDDNIIIFQPVKKRECTPPLSVSYQSAAANLTTTASGGSSPAPAIKSDSKPLLSEILGSTFPKTETVDEHTSPIKVSSSPCQETFTSPQPVQDPRKVPTTVYNLLSLISAQRPLLEAPSTGSTLNHPAVKSEGEENLELDAINRSFNPDDVFAKDPLPGAEAEAEVGLTDVFLRQLIDRQQSAEFLEAGVAKTFKVLDNLKSTFERYAGASETADAWIKTIDKLRTQADRKRTVVGVVGNTGAGKSTVINALLDEERIVPTNCMRACTAVVTEISWNDSTDPIAKYSAEIEFITREDWEKELSTLLKEVLTENGTVSNETTDQNSAAGIAWAKFHAVYPQKTKDSLVDCTVATLMGERSVLGVLGSIKTIKQGRPEPFYRELQRYVDSKEKVTTKKKDKTSRLSQPLIEYWPLIKVVKLYLKSPALATGAVIVDLPGVHDSNPARAAVAQGYMKQCTGLWIVAPITRAVDDKAAKNLLGDSFKRQLKYDGGFSNVTFICSKTDDISVTEAIDSLDIDDQISDLEDQENQEKEKLEDYKEQLANLRDSKDSYSQEITRASDERQIWEELKEKLEAGNQVYAPAQQSKKRRKGSTNEKSRKRRQVKDDPNNDYVMVSDDDLQEHSSASEDESVSDNSQVSREPLTADDITAKLNELKLIRKNGFHERGKIGAQIEDLRRDTQVCKTKLVEVRVQITAICISARNEYSKTSIQQDFAAGIKELDQETAAEGDEENFNPDEELRDYEGVAKSLPVFCVSSRAYQKLCGRLQKDEAVPGFKTVDETEIPKLQAHCKKLTEAGRIQTCRNFLLNFCQQLNTFGFWLSSDGSVSRLTENEKQTQTVFLDKRLSELRNGLDEAIKSCVSMMEKEIHTHILNKHPELIAEAIKLAPEIARGWGAHKSEGGLFWATYKAIVRRSGVYQSSSAGFRDFNAELIEPITKRLATNWERTFQNRLPKVIDLYAQDSSRILHNFHAKVDDHARHNGVGIAQLALLQEQTHTYQRLFKEKFNELITTMTDLQREANRDFTPTIVSFLEAVYVMCTEERGPGSFMRMKAHMDAHVDSCRHQMFDQAMKKVKDNLDLMCGQLRSDMEARSEEIFGAVQHNYKSVFGGTTTGHNTTVSPEEKIMRSEIKKLLLGVDEKFQGLAKGRIEEVEEEMEVDNEAAAGSETEVDDPEDSLESRIGQGPDLVIDEDAPADNPASTLTLDSALAADSTSAVASPNTFVSADDVLDADDTENVDEDVDEDEAVDAYNQDMALAVDGEYNDEDDYDASDAYHRDMALATH